MANERALFTSANTAIEKPTGIFTFSNGNVLLYGVIAGSAEEIVFMVVGLTVSCGLFWQHTKQTKTNQSDWEEGILSLHGVDSC
ncbi:MAG: hypothetical protein ACOVOF_07775, partial [Chryseotalea sp.]